MNDILVPVTEFGTAYLVDRLRALISDNSGLLLQRHIVGPTQRYGGSGDDAVRSVEALKINHEKHQPETFAVIDETEKDEVIGLATIYPGLPLGNMRLPLPAGIPKHERIGRYLGWTRVDYPYATHNLLAWTDGYPPNLNTLTQSPESTVASAYKALVNKVQSEAYCDRRPWTIEPVDSPGYIHRAIGGSGLAKIATRRFEDNEDNRHIPPRSTLYAQLVYKWRSSHGKLKELRYGQEKFFSPTQVDIEDFPSGSI